MKLNVLMFGTAQDSAGSSTVQLELPSKTIRVGELKAALIAKYPDLARLVSFLIAVNAEYAYDETRIINSSDEVAVIPPTSGG